jgi:molecular chaperone DnaK
MEGKTTKIIENVERAWTMPSIMAVTKHGEHLVGLPATRKHQAIVNPTNTVFAFKRLIGWQLQSPEELSSMVLAKMCEMAEQYLNKKVKCVPYIFLSSIGIS